MTKEEILIGAGIVAAVAGAFGLCYWVGDKFIDPEAAENKAIIDKALQKANDVYKKANLTNEEISSETEERIKDVAKRSSFAQIDITNKVMQTEQWVRYAYYYMTDNSAELFDLEPEVESLLNSISVLAGFGKMYPEAAVTDIHEYDLRICDMNKRFLLDVDEVTNHVSSGNFQMKMKVRLQQLNAPIVKKAEEIKPEDNDEGSSWKLGEDGLYHQARRVFREDKNLIRPFAKHSGEGSTEIGNEEPKIPFKQPEEMSNGMFERLSKVFNPGVVGTDRFWFSYDQNKMLYLNIPKEENMCINTIPIDTGTIFGGDNVRILGNYIDQNGMMNGIWVDAEKHPDIASKIIFNSFYLLEPYETMIAKDELVVNDQLIRYIDFSCTPFISKMDKATAERFNKRLLDILSLCRMNIDPKFDIPRFRFDRYDNPDAFVLVSDEAVMNQLPAHMSYNYNNSNKLTFEQRGNSIIQTINGMSQAYDTETIVTTITMGGQAIA